MPFDLKTELVSTVERKKQTLVDITRELVRIPSENTPPVGGELACQSWLAERLQKLGIAVDLYVPTDQPGLTEHPLFHSGRDFTKRPNLAACLRGSGGGRSLLLSGHIDTVPRGTQDWTCDAFGGEVVGNRLFGRGANDMKAGIAMNLFVIECLLDAGIQLKGDLFFESVVDEEFAGCVGTLAGRLRGYCTDAAIIAEPSSLRVCPAQRGGRTAHVKLRGPREGVLDTSSGFPKGAIPQLAHLLQKIPEFAAFRQTTCTGHEMYSADADPVPVSVTKVYTAPWGWNEPLTVPETAQVEIYWQLMPGESQQTAEQQFLSWLDQVVDASRHLFPCKPEVTFPIPWLPGSAIAGSQPLVRELAACAEEVLGSKPPIAGIEGPCDLFIFHEFGIPAVLWGPRGANIHSADEYVEIDSLVAAASVLVTFAAQWCGVTS